MKVRKLFSSVPIGLTLFATVVAPAIIYVTVKTSSTAIGVFFVSGLYILLFMMVDARLWPTKNLLVYAITFAAMLTTIFTHGVFRMLNSDGFAFDRFWQSFVLLIVVTSGAFAFARLVQKVTTYQVDFAVRSVFYVLLLSGLAGVLGYSPFSGVDFPFAISFFSEPSFFAVGFLPFLLYMVVLSGPGAKWLLVLTGFLLALLLQSLTLVVGVAFVALVALRLRHVLLIVPIAAAMFAALLWAAVGIVDINYYLERLSLSTENTNLSALAYMQGWERSYLNLVDSSGAGVGFQQFGIIGRHGDIQVTVVALYDAYTNLLDGTTVASKLIGEFGILGIVLILAYLAQLATQTMWLREASTDWPAIRSCEEVFFRSCFVMFFVDLFIRGVGYFSPTSFFFFASLWWLILGGQSTLRSTNSSRLVRHREISPT